MLRMLPLFAAVLVTWIWSSSYFLNLYAFEQGLGPFTLSGLRFLIGSVVLALISVARRRRNAKPGSSASTPSARRLPAAMWLLLGITGYAAAQGLQYAGQSMLEPTQVSLLLSAGNTFVLLVMDRFALKEALGAGTRIAASVMIAGVCLFYYPWSFGGESRAGIVFVLLSCLGYAAHLTFNRKVLLEQRAQPFQLTWIPMGIGGTVLLTLGLLFEHTPDFDASLALIVLCLGLVNGAAAFLLWTWSQRFLTAADSGLINNLMLAEIALLEVVVSGKNFEFRQWAAIAVVSGAVFFQQLRNRPKENRRSSRRE